MNMKALMAAVALPFLVGTASAQVFVQNGVLVSEDGSLTRGVDMVVGTDGAVRTDVELPSDGEVVVGGWVSPGLFAGFTNVGLVDISQEASTNDTRAGEARTSVANRAADAFNPKAVAVGNTRIEGITHLATVASSAGGIFAGTGAVVNTSGDFDSVLDGDAFVFVRLGESGSGPAGGSRSAAFADLRDALGDAARVAPGSAPDFGDVLTRRDARALRRVLDREMPLVVAANRAADLMRLVELKREFRTVDMIVAGAAEAWQVADALAAAGIKVMIDPHDNIPASFESIGARSDNAQLLEAAGVDYAFTTATADTTHNVRVLAQHAGNAVGDGLDWGRAFAAVSATPRRWFGVSEASTVVWNGDPLELTSAPLAIFIDGEEQSLESRQTALRDRYNPLRDDARPHKYR